MYTPSFSSDEFRCPSHHFAISTDRTNVAYCYIRKNACTAFKRLLNRTPTFTNRIKKKLGFKRYVDPDHIVNIRHLKISHDDYSKRQFDQTIFVYRDPLERAISTYLNKFVDESGAAEIQANYLSIMETRAETASFADFLNYASQGFSKLDCHLWPQKSHLWDIHYSKAIAMNSLHESMSDLIGSGLANQYFHRRENATMSGRNSTDRQLTEFPAIELKAMRKGGVSFSASSFITEQTSGSIHRLYKMDYDMISALSEMQDKGR